MSESRKRDPRGISAVCIRPETAPPSIKSKTLPAQVSSAWSISKITSKIVPTKLRCRNCEHAKNFVFRLRSRFDQERALKCWASFLQVERAKLDTMVLRKRIHTIKIQSAFDLWSLKAQVHCALRCSLVVFTLSGLSKSQKQKSHIHSCFEIWLLRIKFKQNLRAVHQRIQNSVNRNALCTGLNVWRLHSSEAANCEQSNPADPSPNQANPAELTTGSFRHAIVHRLLYRAAVNAVARRSHRAVLTTFSSWHLRVQEQRGRRLLLWKTTHRSWNRLLADALGRWRSSRVDQARLARLSRTITLDATFAVWLSPDPSHKVASPRRRPDACLGYVAVALRLRVWAAWRCACDASATSGRLASSIAALKAMSRMDMQALSAVASRPHRHGQGDSLVRLAAVRALSSAQACLLAGWRCAAGRARVLQFYTTTAIRRRSRALVVRILGAWVGWAQARCNLGRLCCGMRLRAAREELIRTWGNWQARVNGTLADGEGLPTPSLHSSAEGLFSCQALLGIMLWREAVRISGWRKRGVLKGWLGYVKGSSRAIGCAWQAWFTWRRARLIRQTRLSRWRSRHCTLVSWVICQWELMTRICHRKSQVEELRRARRQGATKRILLEWASIVLLLRRRRIIGLSLTRQHLFWQVSTAYSAWANATEHRSEAYCEAPTKQKGTDQGLAENRPLSISCSPLNFSDSDGGVDLFGGKFTGNHGHDPLRFDFNSFREESGSLPNLDAADPGKADWFYSEYDEISGCNGNHRMPASDHSKLVSPRPEGDKKSLLDQIHESDFEGSFQQVGPIEHLRVFVPTLECCTVDFAVEQGNMFHFFIRLGHKEYLSLRKAFSAWFDHEKRLVFYKKLHLKLEAKGTKQKLSCSWEKWATWTRLQAHSQCALSHATGKLIRNGLLAFSLKKESKIAIEAWTVWSSISYNNRTKLKKQQNLTCRFQQRTVTNVVNQWKQTALMGKLIWKIQVLINREVINIKSELDSMRLIELNDSPDQLMPDFEKDDLMTYHELMEELCVPTIQSEILPLCLQRWERELVKLKVSLQDCESENLQLKNCLENATTGTFLQSQIKDAINFDLISMPVNADDEKSHHMTRIIFKMNNNRLQRLICEGFREWKAILKLKKQKLYFLKKILSKYNVRCLANALVSWSRESKFEGRMSSVFLALRARKGKEICSKPFRRWKMFFILSRTLYVKKVRILCKLRFMSAQKSFNVWENALSLGKTRRNISTRILIRSNAQSCLTTIVLWKNVMLKSFNQQLALGRISWRQRRRGVQDTWLIWTKQTTLMCFQRRRVHLVLMWMSRRLKSTSLCAWKEMILGKYRFIKISFTQLQKKIKQILSIIFVRWIQICFEKRHKTSSDQTRRVPNRFLNLCFREWSKLSYLCTKVQCKLLQLNTRSNRKRKRKIWVLWCSKIIKTRKWKRQMMSALERWRFRYYRLAFFKWTELRALSNNHFCVYPLQRLRAFSNVCEHLLCKLLDTCLKNWALCLMRSNYLEILQVRKFQVSHAWQYLQHKIVKSNYRPTNLKMIKSWNSVTLCRFHKSTFNSSWRRESFKNRMLRKSDKLSFVKYLQLFYQSSLYCSADQKKGRMVQRSLATIWNKWVLIKDRHFLLNQLFKVLWVKRNQACASLSVDKWLLSSQAAREAERKVANRHRIHCLGFIFEIWLECASRIAWLKTQFGCIGFSLQKRTNENITYLRTKILSWLAVVQRSKQWAAFSLKYLLLWRTRKLKRNRSCGPEHGQQKQLLWCSAGLMHGFNYVPSFNASKFRICSHPTDSFKVYSQAETSVTCSFWQASRQLYLNPSHITIQFENLIEITVALLIRRRLLAFTYQCWCTFLNSRQVRSNHKQKALLRKAKRAMENWIYTQNKSPAHAYISNWAILVKGVLLASIIMQACSTRSRCIDGRPKIGREFIFSPIQTEDAAESEINLQSSPSARLLDLASRRTLLSNTILRWRVALKALEHQRRLFSRILMGIESTGHKSCLCAAWNLWRVQLKDSQTGRLQAAIQRQASTVESLLHIINIQANITVPPPAEGSSHWVEKGSDSCNDLAARPDP